MFRIVFVIILTGTTFDVIAQNRTSERCGTQTSENPFPWLVGIEFQGVDAISTVTECTGALINRRHVVSNAQCFFNNKPPKSVRFGPNITTNGINCSGERSNSDCPDDGAIRSPIEVVVLHPEFTEIKESIKYYHDVALVRLRDLVQYSDVIQPICLPSADITTSPSKDLDLQLAGIYYDVPFEYTLENLGVAMSYLKREEYLNSNHNIYMAEDQISAMNVIEPKFFYGCMLTGGLLMNKRGDRYELVGLADAMSCLTIKVFTHFFLYVNWIRSSTPDWTPCGTRIVKHVELIVNGAATKAGDWPWHAALYRLSKSRLSYICGGTLLSKKMVLTAAHCVTVSGESVRPEILSVTLGKYYLIGANLESQEKEVHAVIAHENFSPKNYLANDIALLKLKTEAIYSDYVQPACIWYPEAFDRLPSKSVSGTVVGWGFDELDALSSELKQANIPKISDATCIQKNPLFYSNALSNHKKFCAGWANGTSPCNGDSGGGFMVFVPDTAKDSSPDALGSWYVKGIVSMTASLKNLGRCDPNQYVVFTDIDHYTNWVRTHLDD